MSIDRRELILSRVFDVLQSVSGLVTVVRNRGMLQTGDALPACYLLDAHEVTALGQEIGGGVRLPTNRLSKTPDLMSMSPEIYVQEVLVKPHNEGVGPKLNAWRLQILRAIIDDATDTASGTLYHLLAVPNGTVRYMGCTTDLAAGQTLNGQLKMLFNFIYPVVFSEI